MARVSTRVFTVDPSGFQPTELDEPARILREGGIVAFPTETVYGLGVNAEHRAAVERLQEIKQRPHSKPFSVHIADLSDLARWVSPPSGVAEKLIRLYWPGPLTIVFRGKDGADIGIRYPAHAVACGLIRRAAVPVVAPSANLAGAEPATTAQEVLAVFDGIIDALIDGGRVAIRQASTVVSVAGAAGSGTDPCDYHVLREGIISGDMIRRAIKGRRVLFVCTGNSCRSPMAEGLMRKLLSDRLGVPQNRLAEKGYHVASAGVQAFAGALASQFAIEVMAERGIDIAGHRAQPVTQALVDDVDLIVALSPSHRWQLVQWNRDLAGKIEVIRESGVNDPIGGSIDEYRACADEIEQELRFRWLDRVNSL